VLFFGEYFLTLGKVLGNEPFTDKTIVECSMPSVTVGKDFAECKKAFVECLEHSTKNASLVVLVQSCWII
jgi:hypothetical protein